MGVTSQINNKRPKMTHLKAQASNEVAEQNMMALWKGLPVLTRRDDHPSEQVGGFGTLKLSDEAKAYIQYST